MKWIYLLIILSVPIQSMEAQFSVENYKKYLETRKDMNYQQLLDEYPAGKFLSSAPVDFTKAEFSDSVRLFLNITPYEESLINKNGFMVTGRYSPMSFIAAYYEIFKVDLPVYISSDAILNAMHYSFNKIMQNIEEFEFYNETNKILELLSCETEYLYKLNRQDLDTIYLRAVKDFDLFVTVGKKLIDFEYFHYIKPFFKENELIVENILNMINNEKANDIELYSSIKRFIDFSQFKPRGRYTKSDRLQAYFKTMMWLGYIEIMINDAKQDDPEYKQKEIDLRRQTLLASMISIAAKKSNAIANINKVETSMQKLIGPADNITINDFLDVFDNYNQWDITQWSERTWSEFLRHHCARINSGKQLYNSQILFSDPNNPTQIEPSNCFKLFGQRPIIDGYITSNTVYDRIIHNNRKICRLIPSTFDILFALGNDACIQLMKSEISQWGYASNLASLRYLINGYDNKFWNNSIYTNWLRAIKSLNPPSDRSGLPLFMQTAAWWQKTMNTQLASWSQLRHDFIFNSKQPYTYRDLCSFPYAFLEPVPEVYASIVKVFEILQEIFNNDVKSSVLCKHFISVGNKLVDISIKVLNRDSLNNDDKMFLKSMISIYDHCVKYLRGWYPSLYYSYDDFAILKYNLDFRETIDLTVTDYHTAPTDSGGNLKGYVCHAGVGYPNYAVLVWKGTEEREMAYTGVVYTYYEHTTINFKRLTDEEWETLFNKYPLPKPIFTHLYSSDETGNDPGNKISLFTYDLIPSEIEEKNIASSSNIALLAYPNPCKVQTKIAFRLNENDLLKSVSISIIDINGTEVFRTNETYLPAGSYVYMWDLKDNKGNNCPSGVYFITLFTDTGKTVIKLNLNR